MAPHRCHFWPFLILLILLSTSTALKQALVDLIEDYGLSEHEITNEFQFFGFANEVTTGRRKVMDNHKKQERISRKLFNDKYIINSISPEVINSEEMVTVNYYSSYPQYGDWIGAYDATVADFYETVPVKYGWCDDSINSDYQSSGSGTLRFNMTNLRGPIGFYYFKDSIGHNKQRMNVSAVNLTFHNNNEQLRPRVVPTGNTNTYTIVWSSYSNTQPVIKWSTTEAGLATASQISGSLDRIAQDELCGAPANTYGWRDMGQINYADMSGMDALAGTKIYYTFGDAASDTWSSRNWEFYIPPANGTQPTGRGTSLVLFDDLGRGSNDDAFTWEHYGRPSYNTTVRVGHLISTGAVDAVYHGGDISYAVGYEAVWDFFLAMLSPMSASVPYFTTMGNHESDWPSSASFYTGTDSGGECGISAFKLIPQPEPATVNAPWWSYDIGLIHIIGISSEHNYTKGSPQYHWLESDLAAVDRSKTPWIIFGGHRSMYINSNYGPYDNGVYKPSSDIAVSDLMIENLEPLLYKYRVNLGFYGHMHSVQRQSAVYQKKVVQRYENRTIDGDIWAYHEDPQATVQMVIGTGGANVMDNYNETTPDFCEKYFSLYGYTIVEAVNSTYLEWKWYQSSDNEILDRMVITQEEPSSWCGAGFNVTYEANCLTNNPNTQSKGVTQMQTYELVLLVVGVVLAVMLLFWGKYRYDKHVEKYSIKRSNSVLELRRSVDLENNTGIGESGTIYNDLLHGDTFSSNLNSNSNSRSQSPLPSAGPSSPDRRAMIDIDIDTSNTGTI